MILEQLIKSGFRYFLKTRVRVGWWKFCVDLTERWHSERAGMYLKLKAILGRKKTLTLKVKVVFPLDSGCKKQPFEDFQWKEGHSGICHMQEPRKSWTTKFQNKESVKALEKN